MSRISISVLPITSTNKTHTHTHHSHPRHSSLLVASSVSPFSLKLSDSHLTIASTPKHSPIHIEERFHWIASSVSRKIFSYFIIEHTNSSVVLPSRRSRFSNQTMDCFVGVACFGALDCNTSRKDGSHLSHPSRSQLVMRYCEKLCFPRHTLTQPSPLNKYIKFSL